MDGEKIFVDASLVEADASKNSVKKLDDIKLDEQYQELVKRLDERSEDGVEGSGRINREHISSTDPDAMITSQSGVRNLSYKVHRSVDDRKEIITSCSETTGSVNEAHVLEKTIAEHEDVVEAKVKTVVADSKYGKIENYSALKGKGIKTHIKDLGASRVHRGDVFGKDMFAYVAERDVYICPAGKELKRRQHLMERSYAYGKRFGYKRARWRALWRVSIQQLLVATVQNLMNIAKHEGSVGQLCSNLFFLCVAEPYMF